VQRARLAQALALTPSDIQLRLAHGYVLKTLAQASSRAGEERAADDYLRNAESIFRLVLRDLPADPATQSEIASAVNGLGNILAERGDHAEAVTLYREAVRLVPGYGYAWHDLVGSLLALAADGDLRADELDWAWEGLVAAAPGYPGLEPARLDVLRGEIERYRAVRAEPAP
jgi:tetratricopeptide (TPR) repeat protein